MPEKATLCYENSTERKVHFAFVLLTYYLFYLLTRWVMGKLGTIFLVVQNNDERQVLMIFVLR